MLVLWNLWQTVGQELSGALQVWGWARWKAGWQLEGMAIYRHVSVSKKKRKEKTMNEILKKAKEAFDLAEKENADHVNNCKECHEFSETGDGDMCLEGRRRIQIMYTLDVAVDKMEKYLGMKDFSEFEQIFKEGERRMWAWAILDAEKNGEITETEVTPDPGVVALQEQLDIFSTKPEDVDLFVREVTISWIEE